MDGTVRKGRRATLRGAAFAKGICVLILLLCASGCGRNAADGAAVGAYGSDAQGKDIFGMPPEPGVYDAADGEYTPAYFSFTGGSGKVVITCERVTIADGGRTATAELVFSSPHYQYVKADGVQFDKEATEGTQGDEAEESRFLIPVRLNEEMEIVAMTTAMSAPHEISYTIYIGLSGGPGDAVGVPAGEDAPTGASADSGGAGAYAAAFNAAALPGLSYESALQLRYAEEFDIYSYRGGYRLIDVHDSARYLLIPEGKDAPEGLPEEIVLLRAPLEHIYLAATSAMSLFAAADALDKVKLTGTDVSGWQIEAPVRALQSGAMEFAGKYSAPDYELLLERECDLAVESMMIFHAPEVKEMLEDIGIPVFIDTSSYEPHPLGRTEWVRLYGVLAGKEREAEEFFAAQEALLSQADAFEATGKTAAMFSLRQNGTVSVRSAGDYLTRMILLAGGTYALSDLPQDKEKSATQTLSMEEFYARAADADYLIYNASIGGTVESIEALTEQEPLFLEFKAVREGNVWLADKNLYQSTDIAGEFILDLHRMLTDGEESGMRFLRRLR